MPRAIGIDLGTTYSCVGVWQNDHVEIIANDQGNRTTPSYVSFTSEERLIGEAAKSSAANNPSNTVFAFDEESLQKLLKFFNTFDSIKISRKDLNFLDNNSNNYNPS